MSAVLSHLYSWGVQAHQSLYRHQLLKKVKLKTPVLSVGNLSMGGTGKTPIVIEICRQALHRNLKTAVVSRSYKASQKQAIRAFPGSPSSFGDEASLVLESVPGVIVYVGERKWEASLEVEKANPDLDLIVVDDGFQHHRLERNLDLVLIDSSQTFSEFQNSWRREGLKALKRAQVVLLTRWESTPVELQEFWPKKIKEVSGLSDECIGFVALRPQIEGDVLIERSTLVCGVARPESLKKIGNWSDVKIFEDHYVYTKKDILEIETASQRIVTTSKDWIKIKELNPVKEKWSVIQLDLEWVRKAKRLETFFDSLSI